MTALLFAWTLLSPVWVSHRLLRRCLPDASPGVWFPSVVVVTCTLVIVGFQAGALLYGSSAVGFACLMALLSVGEVVVFPLRVPTPVRRPPRLPVLLQAGAALPLCAWVSLHLSREGPRFSAEDLSYHAPLTAWWGTTNGLGVPEFTYQSYFPANAELVSHWLVASQGTDALVSWSSVVWLALLVGSWALFADQLRQNRWLSMSLMGLVLLSPQMVRLSETHTPVDLCVAAVGAYLVAISWVPCAATDREATMRAVLGGLAAGIGSGAKVVVVPLAAWVLFWWVLQARSRRSPVLPLLFLLGLAATGSFWYVRNLWLTGNPVFPAALGPFAGPLDATLRGQTTVASVLASPATYGTDWASYARAWVYWTAPLIGLAVLGPLLGAATVLLRAGLDRSRRQHLLFALGAVLCVGLVFCVSPYSATANLPAFRLHFPFRYLCGAVVLCGMVACPIESLRSRTLPIFGLVSCCLLIWLWRDDGRAAVPLLLGVPAWFVVRWLVQSWWAPWLAAAVALTGLSLQSARSELPVPPGLYGLASGGEERRALFARIDSLPPSRIGVLAMAPINATYVYPSYGRRWQHRPVLLGPDGAARGALHTEEHPWWWGHVRLTPPPVSWRQNLDAAGLDYLLLSRWYAPDAHWMLPVGSSGDPDGFSLVYEDSTHQLWRVEPEPAPPVPAPLSGP